MVSYQLPVALTAIGVILIIKGISSDDLAAMLATGFAGLIIVAVAGLYFWVANQESEAENEPNDKKQNT